MTLTRRGFVATGLAIPALANPGRARAETPVRGVVELFTSQGCSSCPPADRLAAVLARDPSLAVLSLPVDYWDRLGWKDSFAQHAFTRRQEAYASGRGDGEVYTPQAVVNGAAHAVGSDRSAILALASGLPARVRIDGGVAHLDGSGDGTVLLASFWRARTVSIGRGENASATVTYTNVVRALTPVARWSGGPATLPLPALEPDSGLAVLVQRGSLDQPGEILGAAVV